MKALNIKLLVALTFAFIGATVVGTLTHEGGHIAVAKYYGYETTLHYGSMNYKPPYNETLDSIQSIYKVYGSEIRDSLHFPEKERLDSLSDSYYSQVGVKYKYHRHLITIGGPAQTLLTSILGIFILLYRRKQIVLKGMQLWDWISAFLALFSLRFVANMTLSVASELWEPNGTFFGGDEANLARSLDLPPGTFAIPLFCIGLVTALWVIFKVLPRTLRPTFILGGLIGGVLGYLIWLEWLGPILMP